MERGALAEFVEAGDDHVRERLDEDGQVDFKSKAKVFCRTYSFLSSVIPYSNAEWEKLAAKEIKTKDVKSALVRETNE